MHVRENASRPCSAGGRTHRANPLRRPQAHRCPPVPGGEVASEEFAREQRAILQDQPARMDRRASPCPGPRILPCSPFQTRVVSPGPSGGGAYHIALAATSAISPPGALYLFRTEQVSTT